MLTEIYVLDKVSIFMFADCKSDCCYGSTTQPSSHTFKNMPGSSVEVHIRPEEIMLFCFFKVFPNVDVYVFPLTY